MEKETKNPDLDREIAEKLLGSTQMTPAQRNKRLLKWAIRQVLSVGLAYWFLEKSWMKYALWVWIPMAVFNLLMMLFFNHIMAWRLKKRQSINGK